MFESKFRSSSSLSFGCAALLLACTPARTDKAPPRDLAIPVVDAATASVASAPPSAAPPPMSDAAREELRLIRELGRHCAAPRDEEKCQRGSLLAQTYEGTHCSGDMVKPHVTFAWASELEIPHATKLTDADGNAWFVEDAPAASTADIARVDYTMETSEGVALIVPHVTLKTPIPRKPDVERLRVLDARIRKKDKWKGVMLGIKDGDRLVVVLRDVSPEPHALLVVYGQDPKLCEKNEPRELPDDVRDLFR